jgi:hypothetical protein
VLSRLLRPGLFVRVWGAPARVKLINNLLVGPGEPLRGRGEQSHNLQSEDPGLMSREHFDYRLQEASPAVGAGTPPGCGDGFSVAPVAQHRVPAGEEPRSLLSAIDVGAYGRSRSSP